MANDVPPATLRDTVLIWVFATANAQRINKIFNRKMSADDLRAILEKDGSIRIDNKENKKTCESLCEAILDTANIDNFTAMQSILTSMPTLASKWGGGGPVHPLTTELNNAFPPVSNNATPGSGLTGARSRRPATSRRKTTGARRRRK